MDLITATDNGDLEEVRRLLAEGADPNVRDREGYSPVMFFVATPEIVQALIEAGADLNLVSDNRTTALHENYNRPNIIRMLLEAGADPNLPLADSPLVLALHQRQFETAELLLQYGADPNLTDHRGNTALYMALTRIRPTPTSIDIFRSLIQSGADVNDTSQGETHLFSAVDNEELIRLLLEAGADPYAIDRYGNTEMDNALTRGYLNKIRLLSEVIGIDTPGRDGYTPLMRTIKRRPFDIELIKFLLDLGANPLIEHAQTGETVFDFTNDEELHILFTQYIPELPRLREEAIQAGMRGGLTEPALGRYIGRYL
jgi:ankyrin repeat protein